VVGSEAKAELAKKHGCRHVLISGRDELVAGVKALTRGAGVSVVYDAVGKDTFMDSLDCLRRLGVMVSFGNASGPPARHQPIGAHETRLTVSDAPHALPLHRLA